MYKITAMSTLKAAIVSSFQFLVIQVVGTSEMNLLVLKCPFNSVLYPMSL